MSGCVSVIVIVIVVATGDPLRKDRDNPLQKDTDLEHDRVQSVSYAASARRQPQQQPQQQPHEQPQRHQRQQQAPIQVELLPAATVPHGINLVRPVQAQPPEGNYCHFQDLDSPSGLCGGQSYT